jgi:hypothetical protein
MRGGTFPLLVPLRGWIVVDNGPISPPLRSWSDSAGAFQGPVLIATVPQVGAALLRRAVALRSPYPASRRPYPGG